MRLVHYYAPAFEAASGVTSAIAAWTSASVDHGLDVTVLGASQPRLTEQIYDPRVPLTQVMHRGGGRSTRHSTGLNEHVAANDLVVLHEGWTTSHYVAATQLRRADIPYVVMPHGVHNREWRQMLRLERLRRIPERRMVGGAAGVHLFFDEERVETMSMHTAARCFVAPTGTEPVAAAWCGGDDRLLFIGRYAVQHKGLDVLLDTIAEIPAIRRPRVLMRGTDYLGGKAWLQHRLAAAGLADWVEIGGPVHGVEKAELLASTAGYVQPSRWESHSIGLMEALGQGVPCLVSDRMPVSGVLRDAGAAVVSELSPATVARGLDRLASDAAGYGTRGHDFVRREFAWSQIMRRFLLELSTLHDRENRC